MVSHVVATEENPPVVLCNMADDCAGDEEEWLEYSSPCVQLQSDSPEPIQQNQVEESPEEELQSDCSKAEKLQKIREILNRSLSQTCPVLTSPCATEVLTVSQLKGPCNYWLWEKLVTKLNSVRHTKWDGSCLEHCYHRCLNISPETSSQTSTEIPLDYYAKNIFNIHNMDTFSSRTENGGLSLLGKELVNKNEIDYLDKLQYNDKGKSSPNASLEDISPELEWSDNDVKDEMIGASQTTLSFDENEAAADLAKLPSKEILDLRNELKDYTKQYSDILVVELKTRDQYIREKELKNDFISSFLAMQAKIREASQAANKKKFSLQSNPVPNNQSLTTTIPYEIQSEGPSPEILEKLIEIMEAMRVDSSNVPTLLTNYILKVLCK